MKTTGSETLTLSRAHCCQCNRLHVQSAVAHAVQSATHMCRREEKAITEQNHSLPNVAGEQEADTDKNNTGWDMKERTQA